MMANVANSLLKQSKPQVLQSYAASVAGSLQKSASDLFDLNEVHQYQGAGTNHCGPTTLAMIINTMLGEQGYDCKTVNFNDLQDAMQQGSLAFGLTGYRLNTDFFQEVKIGDNISGATMPWGLEKAFQDFSDGLKQSGGPSLGTATFAEEGIKQDLIDNISKGHKTAIMLVWPNNAGAHWVAVANYDEDTDTFFLLDPANPKDELSKMPWSELSEHWSRPLGITNLPDLPFLDEESLIDLLTLEGVIITFKPDK
jgi:hypothetical protein